MKSQRVFFLGFICVLTAAQPAWGQNNPAPPVEFKYIPAQSNTGFLGCGGIVGVDVSLQNCTTLSPTGREFVWSLELQPLPALKLGKMEIPIIPEVSTQYIVPDQNHMYFTDRNGQQFTASNQASLRFAIGYDTYFYDRYLWGDRTALKIGGACLLTRPLDLNPRREGCDDLDLDNWFVRGVYARNIYVRTENSDRDIGYLEATFYHEIPDHDFASKLDTTGLVKNVFNDDGKELTFADVRFLAKTPSLRLQGLPWVIDLRVGGGVGVAHQIETARGVRGDLHLTLTHNNNNLSFTGAVRYTARHGSYSGLDEDRYFWTAQAYMQWRPDIVVFWDHRY